MKVNERSVSAQDRQNPGTSETAYRPGEGSSSPGGKDRASYERYGNYGLVDPQDSPDVDGTRDKTRGNPTPIHPDTPIQK